MTTNQENKQIEKLNAGLKNKSNEANNLFVLTKGIRTLYKQCIRSGNQPSALLAKAFQLCEKIEAGLVQEEDMQKAERDLVVYFSGLTDAQQESSTLSPM